MQQTHHTLHIITTTNRSKKKVQRDLVNALHLTSKSHSLTDVSCPTRFNRARIFQCVRTEESFMYAEAKQTSTIRHGRVIRIIIGRG